MHRKWRQGIPFPLTKACQAYMPFVQRFRRYDGSIDGSHNLDIQPSQAFTKEMLSMRGHSMPTLVTFLLACRPLDCQPECTIWLPVATLTKLSAASVGCTVPVGTYIEASEIRKELCLPRDSHHHSILVGTKL